MTAGVAPYTVPRTLTDGPIGRRPPAWWGMVCLIVTESALFFFLLYGYVYTAFHASAWPPEGAPDLSLAVPNTVILLLSSGTMWWADRSVRRGRVSQLKFGLLLTAMLGVVFVCMQAVEWSQKTFSAATDAYGSFFFTITGFHGAHVIVGLLMIAVTLLQAFLGYFNAQRHLRVSLVAMYWHFVDIVWLFVFATLFVAPHLG